MTEEANGPNGSWENNRKFILKEIERLDDRLVLESKVRAEGDDAMALELREMFRQLLEQQTRVREDIAGLKAQAGIIGGLAGAVSSFLGTLIPK